MAYQMYYPQYYQQQQVMPQPQPQVYQQPQQNIEPQIQNGGFVSVRSESEIMNYPVGPGRCVTFKVENQPIVIEKSMGFSQLDAPRIERYRLVKEEPVLDRPATSASADDKISMKDIEARFEAVWDAIDKLKNESSRPAASKKKKEVTEDDSE